MFFLLRMTFWLGLVLVLLPTRRRLSPRKLPQIGASDAGSRLCNGRRVGHEPVLHSPAAACEIGSQAATSSSPCTGRRAQGVPHDHRQEGHHRIDRRRPPAGAPADTLTAD